MCFYIYIVNRRSGLAVMRGLASPILAAAPKSTYHCKVKPDNKTR